jgi:phage terminase small subunit
MENPLSMLNEQQKQFCLFVSEGKTAITAARLAGYKPNKVQIENRLMQNPKILHAIRHLQKKYEAKIVASRAKVLEGFLEAIEQAKMMGDPAVQIAGWREVGKMCGYYAPEIKEVHHTVGAKRVISQLEVMSDEDLMKVIEQDTEVIEAEAHNLLEVKDAEYADDTGGAVGSGEEGQDSELVAGTSEGTGVEDSGEAESDPLRPADEAELRGGVGAP